MASIAGMAKAQNVRGGIGPSALWGTLQAY
jgi:hypothetical protein